MRRERLSGAMGGFTPPVYPFAYTSRQSGVGGSRLRPARPAVECTGPPVRDPDKAADCPCSCHPKPADAELHGGGLSCGCQLTPEEREQSWKKLAGQLDSLELDAGIIADGEDDDLTGPDGGYDVTHALTVAVHAVRTFPARRECEHQQPTDPRHLFCSWCGVRLTEADKWTTA